MKLFVSSSEAPISCSTCAFGDGEGCALAQYVDAPTGSGCVLNLLPASFVEQPFKWEDLKQGCWRDETPLSMVSCAPPKMVLYKRRRLTTVEDLFSPLYLDSFRGCDIFLRRYQAFLSLPALNLISLDSALAILYGSVPATRYGEIRDKVLRLPAFSASDFEGCASLVAEKYILRESFRIVAEQSSALLDEQQFNSRVNALSSCQVGIPVYLNALATYVLPEYVSTELNVGDYIWLNGVTRTGTTRGKVKEKQVNKGLVTYVVSVGDDAVLVHPYDFGKFAFLTEEAALSGLEQGLHLVYPIPDSLRSYFLYRTYVYSTYSKVFYSIGIHTVGDLSGWCTGTLRNKKRLHREHLQDLVVDLALMDLQESNEEDLVRRVASWIVI